MSLDLGSGRLKTTVFHSGLLWQSIGINTADAIINTVLGRLMWMRQMTLSQIDLEGNGFHKALNAFIIFHTMTRRGEAQKQRRRNPMLPSSLTWREITVKSKCCKRAYCGFVVNPVLMNLTALLYLNGLKNEGISGWSSTLHWHEYERVDNSETMQSIRMVLDEELLSLRCQSQMNIHPQRWTLLPPGPRH